MRFENLDVWKRSSRLGVEVYKELAPSNIAEGFERDTDKDGNKFFIMSMGLVQSCESKSI